MDPFRYYMRPDAEKLRSRKVGWIQWDLEFVGGTAILESLPARVEGKNHIQKDTFTQICVKVYKAPLRRKKVVIRYFAERSLQLPNP